MIPAILAAPLVQGVVGSVVGGVMNAFRSSAPTTQAAPPAFSPYMDRVARPTFTAATAPTGMMHGGELRVMNQTQATNWAKDLAGRHVDATDNAGRSISGTVDGYQLVGHSVALSIGGHLVTLSQLNQISWSPKV